MRYITYSLLCFFLISASTSLVAQTITLEAGYVNPKRINTTASETYFDAIRIGGLVNYDIPFNFQIQTGVAYNIGYSHKIQKYGVSTDSVTYTTWSHALEIPVRLFYRQKLFKDFSAFGFAGPNIQIGLFQPQKIKTDFNDPAVGTITNITSGKADLYTTQLHRINFQLGAGGGIQWRQFILKSGYDWGINNLDKTGSSRIHQGNWYASFAYQLK